MFGLATPRDLPEGAGKRCWREGRLEYLLRTAATCDPALDELDGVA